MFNLDRRKLLKLGVVCGVVAGTAGTGLWVGRDKVRKLQPGELADYLRSNFDYLAFNFDDAQFIEHSKAYLEHYDEIARESWHLLRGRDADAHLRKMDHFAVTFLMSTDFFLHAANESRPINYVMLYHPYLSPCWNPLSMGAA